MIRDVTFWSAYWLGWFILTFVVGFLPAEIYALATNTQHTLSWTIWHLEGFLPGQSVVNWTAVHVLVGGALLLVLGWLIGHLVFGIWT
jgi:hypothetical protein